MYAGARGTSSGIDREFGKFSPAGPPRLPTFAQIRLEMRAPDAYPMGRQQRHRTWDAQGEGVVTDGWGSDDRDGSDGSEPGA
jgi:hypothetical protein